MPRRGHEDRDYLFRTHDLRGVLEQQRAALKKDIDDAPPAIIHAGSVDEAAEPFVQAYRMHVPELTVGAISVELEEVKVDVSHDPMRFGYFRGRGKLLVPGIRATYFVPYVGDSYLFRCHASTLSSTVPFAEIDTEHLVLRFERPDHDVAATKTAFDRELAAIQKHLTWLRNDIQPYHEELPRLAKQAVTSRRERLAKMAEQVQALGVTVRPPSQRPSMTQRRQARPQRPTPTATGRPQPRAAGKKVEVTKKYDVALSFAGEDRKYVEEVATLLKATGVDVFYDLFEQVDLWGKNLVDHLADIYQNKSRYVVMFISEYYVKKAWTRHERQHAQARALVENEDFILPARFDDTKVPGLPETIGHVDLRKMGPKQLAELILTKLGKSG